MSICSELQGASEQLETVTGLPFVLSTGKEHLYAPGVRDVLDVRNLEETPEAARRFLSDARSPAILVGALPFRADGRPYLVRPSGMIHGEGPYRWSCSSGCNAVTDAAWSATADPPREVYERMVADALRSLGSDPALLKVVLGRRLIFDSAAEWRPRDILCRLASDRDATTFAVPLPSGDGRQRLLVGASPELLLERKGERVLSVPLAGSAKRSADPAEDRGAAEALLRSDKDRREHEFVVESVVERLRPYCRDLRWSREPALMRTATMWHLGTRIEGELNSLNASSLELAVALHPTPAVCGVPRELAAETIARLEPFDRGFFAGAVGWCDSAGDGRWMVTIRCAEIHGNRATLFAGAGIVPGSDPHAEAAETAAKFQTMLSALAIDAKTLPGGEA